MIGNVEELEKEYRVLYWELNEWQLVANDPKADREAVNAMIASCNELMKSIVQDLGYVPSV